MDYVEAEGNSIDDAIQRALEQLGVEREKAEIEILCNTTRGLFGLGGRKARVRATIRRGLEVEEFEQETDDTEQVEALDTSANSLEESLEDDFDEETPESAEGAAASEKTIEQARELLQEIVRLMQVDARVDIVEGQRLVINGDKRGILIGRRGQTLDALEYVLNRMIMSGDNAGRIAIDSENYRERRRQSLEALAVRLAKRVQRRGKPVSLNPMNPRDRRIIHLALQGDSSLVTRSTGDGYFRRLVIAPAGSRGGNRQRGKRRSAEVRD